MTDRVVRDASTPEEKLDQCATQAQQDVDSAISKTKQDVRPPSPRGRLRSFRRPAKGVQQPSRGAEAFYLALECLKKAEQISDANFRSFIESQVSQNIIENVANRTGCVPVPGPGACDANAAYRTVTGECNNLANPLWGRSIIPFARLLPAYYIDDIQLPYGWNSAVINGYPLPSPRLVSRELVSIAPTCNTNTAVDDTLYSLMLMQWGQFLDHDLDFTPVVDSDFTYDTEKPCDDNNCNKNHPCFPIEVPNSDCRLNTQCLGFTRSAAMCPVRPPPVERRQQVNQLTAYIDGSNVYGSTQDDLDYLREPGSKFLKVGDEVAPGTGKYLLPDNNDNAVDCELEDENGDATKCFLAGDRRVNEQVALTAMHTIWMREHNRIAKKLSNDNPTWSAETVFQESRKIVYAEMEHITFNEWLPKILGPVGMADLGTYSYNANQDASIFNEFATAALRLGHTLLQPEFLRLDDNYQVISDGNLVLHKGFFAPQQIRNYSIDNYLRGLLVDNAKLRDAHLNAELTEHLFELSNKIALDLASLNIQRGRDHGIRPYNQYRELCGLTLAQSFADLSGEITEPTVLATLQTLYGTPDNIDLWVGLISETNLLGSRVGPTLKCLLVKQFKAVRDGDRFWYENSGQFTNPQLNEIKKATLSRVICDNSDGIITIQADAFIATNARVDCATLPEVDLKKW